jgi:hypothetical protein
VLRLAKLADAEYVPEQVGPFVMVLTVAPSMDRTVLGALDAVRMGGFWGLAVDGDDGVVLREGEFSGVGCSDPVGPNAEVLEV